MQIEDNQVFLLYANCMPVKGAVRSVICDLHRINVEFIPNDLYEVLTRFKRQTFKKIKEHYGLDNTPVILEYFSFLVEKEYGFICSEKEASLFPDISYRWDAPHIIENAIIDVNENSDHNYGDILSQLEELGCKALQVRFFAKLASESLHRILKLFSNSRIESIELLLAYSADINEENIRDLLSRYKRIISLTFHSCPSAPEKGVYNREGVKIEYTDQVINSSDHCGFISPRSFHLAIDTFMESQQFNTCLNRKISIDVNGEIKNCPSMNFSYGNIKSTRLEEGLSRDGFKKYWQINKDQIEVCRDCEFRYICSDCRAFTDKEGSLYAKPLKCNYNPYEARWVDK